MDVVANSGAIGGVVIGSEDPDVGSFAKNRLEDERDEVRLWVVDFSNLSFGVGSRGIEISQGDIAEIVGSGVPVEDSLTHELGVAVGRDRVLRVLLVEGDVLRHSVGGAATGKDDFGDSGVDAGSQKLVHSGDVVADVFPWVCDRFTDIGIGGEVEDAGNTVFSNCGGHEIVVTGVASLKRSEFRRPVVPFGKVVEDDGVEAVTFQLFTGVATDVTGTTNHQHIL